MITEEARRKKIQDALVAYQQQGGTKPTVSLEWRGQALTLPVILLDLDAVLLNSRSHRLRAQLEGHPKYQLVLDEPWSEEAQEVVAELLKKAHRDFAALKANLAEEGQREPGFVTREGVLINANTRAVALRELKDPSKRWVKVGVLPPDADPQELAELELRLQVQKELKDPYSLTNELLFIEDMARNFHKTSGEIALDLRWATNDAKNLKKGAAEVDQRRRILALIREMQQLANPPVELTFFDEKLEQLKVLEARYSGMVNEDPGAAERFRANWLCAALAGSSSVHDLRAVDENFADEYLRPRLAEDPQVSSLLDVLFAPPKRAGKKKSQPRGLDLLDPNQDESADGGTDVRRLISIFSSTDTSLTLAGTDGKKFVLDLGAVRDGVRRATRDAIKDFKSQGRAQNRLDEPIALLRDAVSRMRSARLKFREVRDNRGFGQTRRGKFEYHLNQAKKAIGDLDREVRPPSPRRKSGRG